MASPRQTRFSIPSLDYGNPDFASPIPLEPKTTCSTPVETLTTHNSTFQVRLPAQLVGELAEILADILVEEFQGDRRVTVGSPQQNNRNLGLNSLRLRQDEE